ncbi:MAG TPA: ester cyclase [Anaerolineales bacterium]
MQNNQQEFHKQITREIFEQAWSNANFGGLDELLDSTTQFHIRNHTAPMSAEDTRRVICGWHRAFSNFRFTIKAMVAEGDLVAVRLTLSGTHRGTWKDIPATGKQVRITAMMFFRFENGKLMEIWEDFDELGIHQQLNGGK